MGLIRNFKIIILFLINVNCIHFLFAQDNRGISLLPNGLVTYEKFFNKHEPEYIFDANGLLNLDKVISDSLNEKINFGATFTNSIYKNEKSITSFSPKLKYFDKNFSLFIELSLINNYYNYELLSTNFARKNISGDYNSALLKYTNNSKKISVAIGRAPIWWGQSMTSSLILNPISGAYDNIYFTFNFNDNFKLETFTAQLDSKILENEVYNRFLAGHKISILNKSNFLMNFGELFIYTGKNQSVDLKYLNPIIPYYVVDINNDYVLKDNSNSILFIDFRYMVKNSSYFYGEFIIDDFQLDDTGLGNSLGFKFGLSIETKIAKRKFSLIIENNNISKSTYSHHGNFSYFLYNNRPIGFNYGQGCKTLNARINYEFNKEFSSHISFLSLKKDNNSIISKWNYDITNTGDFDAESSNQNYIFFEFGIFKKFNNLIFDIGYSSYPIINQNINGVLNDINKNIYLDIIFNFEWYK